METVNIRVLDYYNKPGYYRFMPNGMFAMLEQAFLEDKEYCDIPEEMYTQMSDKLNNYLAALETAASDRNPSIIAN